MYRSYSRACPQVAAIAAARAGRWQEALLFVQGHFGWQQLVQSCDSWSQQFGNFRWQFFSFFIGLSIHRPYILPVCQPLPYLVQEQSGCSGHPWHLQNSAGLVETMRRWKAASETSGTWCFCLAFVEFVDFVFSYLNAEKLKKTKAL